MDFVEWISRLKNRDTPTGDLASDILSDKNFPRNADKETILSYLRSCNACDGAISAFKSAWRSYQSYLKKHQ